MFSVAELKKRIFSCACCACAKILREKQTLNKRYKNKLNRRLKSIFFQRESERVVFGAVIIVYGIFISMIYGLPYMLSIAHYAERDAKIFNGRQSLAKHCHRVIVIVIVLLLKMVRLRRPY